MEIECAVSNLIIEIRNKPGIADFIECDHCEYKLHPACTTLTASEKKIFSLKSERQAAKRWVAMESPVVRQWNEEESAPASAPLPSRWKGKPGRIDTLAQLVVLLRAEFEGQDVVCPERLQALMAAYRPASHLDWKPFAKFDRYRYTRNLVDEGDGKYNLMMLCWAEGHGSAVHDHAGAHCVMRVLTGSLFEVRFAWPDETTTETDDIDGRPLHELSRCMLQNGDVCYINDSQGLHRVENASHSERAVSLHLYCPPFGACGVFNQRTGRRSTCPVTFWSRPEDVEIGRIRRRERQQPPAEDN